MRAGTGLWHARRTTRGPRLGKVTIAVDCRNAKLRGERDDKVTMHAHEIIRYDKPARFQILCPTALVTIDKLHTACSSASRSLPPTGYSPDDRSLDRSTVNRPLYRIP